MSETPTNYQLAYTAARWWGDTFRKGAEFDNGATDPANLMTRRLAEQGHAQLRGGLSSEQVSAFEVALCAAIVSQLEGSPYGVTLRVDYHADQTLADAAEAAGITVTMMTFPFKTMMKVNPQGDPLAPVKGPTVSVSAGYGAEWEYLPLVSPLPAPEGTESLADTLSHERP